MEPERHIEKLLRAIGKKRGEQAEQPFELHPVARQELLREVANRSEQKSGGGLFSRLLSAIKPKFAIAAGATAVAVIGIWLAVPPSKRTEKASSLASANLGYTTLSAKKPEPAAAPPASAAPVTPPSLLPEAPSVTETKASHKLALSDVQLNANSADSSVDQNGSSNLPIIGSAQPAVVPRSSPGAPSAGGSIAGATAEYKLSLEPASSSAALSIETNAIAPAMTAAFAESEKRNNSDLEKAPASFQTSQVAMFDAIAKDRAREPLSPVSRQFYRVAAAPANRQRGFGGGGGAGGATPVLASFQMEQNGREIRVVDADGSVYRGSWQTSPFDNAPVLAAPAADATPGRAAVHNNFVTVAPATKAEPQRKLSPQYFFRVIGTNRNLKQNVVFSGNFIPLTNFPGAPAPSGGISGAPEARRAGSQTAASLLLLNSRIAGKVVIGNQREIEVNATPAP